VGLVIGLELTLLAKILFDVKPTTDVLWWSCAIGLLITAIVQLGVLFTLLPVGYGSKTLPSPGSPEAFWPKTTGDEHEFIKEIGIHYANSYKELHTLVTSVATDLSRRSRHFGISLGAFALLVALCGFIAFRAAQHPSPPPTTIPAATAHSR
jgi:hypothetical protein